MNLLFLFQLIRNFGLSFKEPSELVGLFHFPKQRPLSQLDGPLEKEYYFFGVKYVGKKGT